MKKSIMLIGNLAIFAFLVGAIFRSQYSQLADILVVFSCLLFSLGYTVPLYFEKCKVINDTHSKMIAFWIMLLMAIFPIAFMFKILHFPFADELVWVTLGIVVVSIPFFVYHGVKKKEPLHMMTFQNEMIIAIFLVSCLVVLFAANVKESDDSIAINRHELKEVKFHEAKSNELYAVIISSVTGKEYGADLIKEAKEVKGASDSLNDYIVSIEKMIAEEAGQKNWIVDSVEILKNKDNCSAPMAILLDKGGKQKGLELKQKINSYRDRMKMITSVRGKDVIALFFNTENVNGSVSWESNLFEDHSLVCVIIALNQLRSNIRLLEAETMSYIQAKTAKANYDFAPPHSSCDYLYGCFM